MKKIKKRTNMQPAERRNQLLNCAQTLFFSKGYETTTINDILAAADVSKGGFYHHFGSKDELLVGIMERFVRESGIAFHPVLEIEGLAALERYKLYIKILREQQTAEALSHLLPMLITLFRDENAFMLLRLTNSLAEAVVPVFAEVLKRGMEEGIFKIEDPLITARLIVQIANHHQFCLKPAVEAASEQELRHIGKQLAGTLKAQGIATDRLLGIPDGTTIYRNDDFAPTFIEMLVELNFPKPSLA